jgi:small subunit ribosomal protein S15
MLSKEEKAEIVKKYGKDEKDTGSARVQIAILTKRISDLTEHLKENKHDYCTKRAMFVLNGKRSGLISFYDRQDHEACVALLKELGVRG